MLRKPLGGLFAVMLLAVAAACSSGQTDLAHLTSGAGNAQNTIGNAPYVTNTVNGMQSYLSIAGKGSLTVSASASAPSSVTAFAARRADTVTNSPILYYTVTATSATNITGVTLLNISMPAAPAGSAYVAYYSGSSWITAGEPSPKPGTYSNGVLGIPGGSINPTAGVNLTSGQSLYLVAYTGGVATPTPSPPPAPVASPSALTLSVGQTGSVTITTGDNDAVTAVSDNPSAATVKSPVTADATGAAAFTITAVGAGSAKITFTDAYSRTTTANVTVTTAPPTPMPSPANAIIGLGDTISVGISAKPSTAITVTSTNTSIATVSASTVTTDGTGAATVNVTGVSAGATTITFTDPYNDVGTMNVTVSAIKNGNFATGLTNWTACSFQHAAYSSGPVDPSTPTPNVPVPAQTSAATTPVPLASVSNLVGAATPPANDNPNATGTAPPVLGSSVALIGSIDSATPAPGVNEGAYPKGNFGLCQSFAVPATATYLSFWVWEGGSNYSFATSDQEADILDSTGTTLEATLFAEENCYIHPSLGWAPGAASTSGCWPAAYGGDSSDYMDWIGGGYWQERGPFNLSSYEGQTVTLYIGNWSYYLDQASKYAQFMYVGNVETTTTSTFPTAGPLHARRNVGAVTLVHRTP